MSCSALQKVRYNYEPRIPDVLQLPAEAIALQYGSPSVPAANKEEIQPLFPHTYGQPVVHFIKGTTEKPVKPFKAAVILSGGQAPGGHNVIAGLYDRLKSTHPESQLLGFLDGPQGLISGASIEITGALVDAYRNTGGFDIIGSGRTKIETLEQIQAAAAVVVQMHLDALVIIGGDDSNTNAAVLAEYFLQEHIPVQVIGVPKTIDGDLKCDMVETSFGFDTATKVYSGLIGNIARDACSAKKYWHFIKLMGRSASHITLECALRTQPNICLIAEEVATQKMTLRQITGHLVSIIVERSKKNEHFGIVLIPEGIIEFIPEMQKLIQELNNAMAQDAAYFNTLELFTDKATWVEKSVSAESAAVFQSMPEKIAAQFLTARDAHGNVIVSAIQTEALLIEQVKKQLAEMKKEGTFTGPFSTQSYFFGYEGRADFPSNFDADYCYSLGHTAFLLIAHGLTGYMASVCNLTASPSEWKPCGIPLTALMDTETRSGRRKAVIKKALVDLRGKPFAVLCERRKKWAVDTCYIYPGPIQYFGPAELCDRPPETLLLEKGNKGIM